MVGGRNISSRLGRLTGNLGVVGDADSTLAVVCHHGYLAGALGAVRVGVTLVRRVRL